MSLHEFLREGGEVSYRIMNRLSHLIQNLDISGTTFSFGPNSRKNSWRDWDGKARVEEVQRVSVCLLVLALRGSSYILQQSSPSIFQDSGFI